jgi:hypothetical protein
MSAGLSFATRVAQTMLLVLFMTAAAANTATTPSANGVGQLAIPALVSSDVPQVRKLGEGRLRFFGLHVYDSTLWQAGMRYDPMQSLALELRYAMNLKGKDIAERSIKEMREQGYTNSAELMRWLGIMEKLFPDIAKGDRLVGTLVVRDGQVRGARFHHGDREIGFVEDAAFARAFFEIWLSEKTSQPALRRSLIGMGS